jgi:hypothetical protein
MDSARRGGGLGTSLSAMKSWSYVSYVRAEMRILVEYLSRSIAWVVEEGSTYRGGEFNIKFVGSDDVIVKLVYVTPLKRIEGGLTSRYHIA